MSYQTKRKIMNGVVYLALALVILAILCVSIITFTSANKPVEPNRTPIPQTTSKAETSSPTPHKTKNETPPATTTPEATPTPTPTPVPTKTKVPADNSDPMTFSLPTEGNIMKDFCIEVPVFSFTMNDYRTHSGIDISAPVGSAVCSIAKGTVMDIYNDPLFGKTVCVDHGGGLISIYANLEDELASGIAAGVNVGEGQILGAVGNSALIECAESDHLHFEIKMNGKNEDPEIYINYSEEDEEDIPGIE